jgi:hypothetical protein
MLRMRHIAAFIASLLVAGPAFGSVFPLTIPGTANPWLAGMPAGSTSGTMGDTFDSVPAESPVEFPFAVTDGECFTFSATGTVSHGSELLLAPLTGPNGAQVPDGDGLLNVSRNSPNADGSENGISNITVPIDALLGVFLTSNPPSDAPPPAALDFSTAAERSYSSLYPLLQQVFFIGAGSPTQMVYAPAGATELWFGPMDEYNWSDNTGDFFLDVTDSTCVMPEPASLSLLALGGLGLLKRRRR